LASNLQSTFLSSVTSEVDVCLKALDGNKGMDVVGFLKEGEKLFDGKKGFIEEMIKGKGEGKAFEDGDLLGERKKLFLSKEKVCRCLYIPPSPMFLVEEEELIEAIYRLNGRRGSNVFKDAIRKGKFTGEKRLLMIVEKDIPLVGLLLGKDAENTVVHEKHDMKSGYWLFLKDVGKEGEKGKGGTVDTANAYEGCFFFTNTEDKFCESRDHFLLEKKALIEVNIPLVEGWIGLCGFSQQFSEEVFDES